MNAADLIHQGMTLLRKYFYQVKEREKEFYEDQLEECTGKRSTKELSPGRDYDRVMAHFEIIAGDSIKWQMRVHGGDARRIIHAIRTKIEEFDGDEKYFQAIARQSLRLDVLPPLETLTPAQLLIILRAVMIQLRRQSGRGQSQDKIRTDNRPRNYTINPARRFVPKTKPVDCPF